MKGTMDKEIIRTNNPFVVTAPFEPTGDQPQAIDRLVKQVSRGDPFSVLRGITGTGKTNVMAHTIARLGRPTLVLCHNKTLAAQLARELRSCLQRNQVHLFVSYYNHYVPESFNEVTNKYTAKKSSINDELDALRHLATRALVQHNDVVVVSSVSCIYGLGMPKSYLNARLQWSVGNTTFDSLDDIAEAMQTSVYTSVQDDIHSESNDLSRGHYQLYESPRGATLVLWPPSESYPLRVDFEKDTSSNGPSNYLITSIAQGNTTGLHPVDAVTIFPAKHHLTNSTEVMEEAIARIRDELHFRAKELRSESKTDEAERLTKRVTQDLHLLEEVGTCAGVENYSRHMALRGAGEPPDTLLDYFSCNDGAKDWLLLVDESHVTLPQLRAMYNGDRARKERLIKHGYRLPSALDNRPLTDKEFWERVPQTIFVSATPSQQELEWVSQIPDNQPVDMIIRPTFVCDPIIEVRPPKDQLKDLLKEINIRVDRGERCLVMTLTKRDAEDMADFLLEHGVAASYIHSGLTTHERSEALKALQSGQIDCLVGVNLLREGLDLPQVSLVAVLNADSEGFLRSETALLQTIGRAARNVDGMAILYAKKVTESMQRCMDATSHRRTQQILYNEQHKKEMRSTTGSSVLSIFDLLKDQIEAEQSSLQQVYHHKQWLDDDKLLPVPTLAVKKDFETVDGTIPTDHIPSKPGVYFWKDGADKTLYIGKAKRLRSRVKSYLLPSAKHSSRIKAMLKKAQSVEFIITPSERDALLLEANLIKHHQPVYNVLLKDDASYPYICASIGDKFPQFSIAPQRKEGESRYKYFGPYPDYSEVNRILDRIEEQYKLRAQCFQSRCGELPLAEYKSLFNRVLDEVFVSSTGKAKRDSLPAMRAEYQWAADLFESEHNENRDVVVIAEHPSGMLRMVHLLQLRNGVVARQFSYDFEVHSKLESPDDMGDVLQAVLERQHYPAGEAVARDEFSFFPNEVLVQYPVETTSLKKALREARNAAEPSRRNDKVVIRGPSKRGPRKVADKRALEIALENANQILEGRHHAEQRNVAPSSVDGTAAKELAEMLSLRKKPERIECYDISHTQGEATVASRVVFLNGVPAPHLYRLFNVKTVDGVDDYASLEEVLERRFKRAWANGSDGLVDQTSPWAMPDLVVIDGGKGQLSSALKGMAKADVYSDKSSCTSGPVSQEFGISFNENYLPSPTDTDGRHHYLPIISIAKNKEEIFVPSRSEPINNRPDSPALLLIRALRDESHRFAIRKHRNKRKQTSGL
eukprot:Nitzschia sp. Nitz4//scaffold12_size214221//205806//209603//NITZ4_001541-RA/size214221-processed-gene-0.184-mRNA-1//-1//CDS//3329535143//4608//frame0